MSSSGMYGYKLNKNYTRVTVWIFKRGTRRLVGTLTRTTRKGLTRIERFAECMSFLSGFNIRLPKFVDRKGGEQ